MENNELLDFNAAQSNFDFFRFTGNCREEQLKEACEGVMRVAYATVQNMCELGVRLKELKESGDWHHVVDPDTGDRFLYANFAKFCKYAFGFSPTRTSNLLSLSAFLYLKEDGSVAFLNDKYKEYKTSALIEIAPVNAWERRFFDETMTVDEIRLVKKYMKSDDYKSRRGSLVDADDMLDMAKAWQRHEEIMRQRPKQLPGQLEMSDEMLGAETWGENPTSDFAEETETTDFVEELVQTVAQAQIRYEFAAREKVRSFLADYNNWPQEEAQEPFVASYVYDLSDDVRLHAREEYVCKDLTTFEKKTVVRYFWEENGRPEVAVGKTRLVVYLRTAKAGAR